MARLGPRACRSRIFPTRPIPRSGATFVSLSSPESRAGRRRGKCRRAVMVKGTLFLAAFGLAVLAGAGKQTSEKASNNNASKASVVIVATGGTIAGAQESQSSYGYTSGQFKVE